MRIKIILPVEPERSALYQDKDTPFLVSTRTHHQNHLPKTHAAGKTIFMEGELEEIIAALEACDDIQRLFGTIMRVVNGGDCKILISIEINLDCLLDKEYKFIESDKEKNNLALTQSGSVRKCPYQWISLVLAVRGYSEAEGLILQVGTAYPLKDKVGYRFDRHRISGSVSLSEYLSDDYLSRSYPNDRTYLVKGRSLSLSGISKQIIADVEIEYRITKQNIALVEIDGVLVVTFSSKRPYDSELDDNAQRFAFETDDKGAQMFGHKPPQGLPKASESVELLVEAIQDGSIFTTKEKILAVNKEIADVNSMLDKLSLTDEEFHFLFERKENDLLEFFTEDDAIKKDTLDNRHELALKRINILLEVKPELSEETVKAEYQNVQRVLGLLEQLEQIKAGTNKKGVKKVDLSILSNCQLPFDLSTLTEDERRNLLGILKKQYTEACEVLEKPERSIKNINETIKIITSATTKMLKEEGVLNGILSNVTNIQNYLTFAKVQLAEEDNKKISPYIDLIDEIRQSLGQKAKLPQKLSIDVIKEIFSKLIQQQESEEKTKKDIVKLTNSISGDEETREKNIRKAKEVAKRVKCDTAYESFTDDDKSKLKRQFVTLLDDTSCLIVSIKGKCNSRHTQFKKRFDAESRLASVVAEQNSIKEMALNKVAANGSVIQFDSLLKIEALLSEEKFDLQTAENVMQQLSNYFDAMQPSRCLIHYMDENIKIYQTGLFTEIDFAIAEVLEEIKNLRLTEPLSLGLFHELEEYIAEISSKPQIKLNAKAPAIDCFNLIKDYCNDHIGISNSKHAVLKSLLHMMWLYLEKNLQEKQLERFIRQFKDINVMMMKHANLKMFFTNNLGKCLGWAHDNLSSGKVDVSQLKDRLHDFVFYLNQVSAVENDLRRMVVTDTIDAELNPRLLRFISEHTNNYTPLRTLYSWAQDLFSQIKKVNLSQEHANHPVLTSSPTPNNEGHRHASITLRK